MELILVGWLQFNDSDEIVFVAELFDCRKVSVLMLLDWRVMIRVSEAEFVGILILQHMSEDTSGQLAHHCRPFLSQFYHSKHVAPPLIGSMVYVGAVFSSDDVLVNQISSVRAVDHNI